MNWDAIGATGEILGAIVTVGTIFYLAIQIRHNQKTNQSATEYNANMQFTKFCERTADDKDLQGTWDKVARNDPELKETDALQFIWHIAAMMYACEAVWKQHLKGFLSDDTWKNWERFSLGLLRMPLVKRWWADRHSLHSPEFFDYFDRLLEREPDWSMPDGESWITEELKKSYEKSV